jgi:hypothetical protein
MLISNSDNTHDPSMVASLTNACRQTSGDQFHHFTACERSRPYDKMQGQ